ncbi:zinc ribbon domain-containing protein [Streptomyces lydicamycinicus]|uniref:zinc ribbon domain-containing protein n=1 Tax=Streptomyces lydicamycinicus TaxID=1546107 RepID=UPI002035241F|nr:zinc ribbon domain-containing protein [Streptomyces lydicamycinicus]USA00788.1 zinc ribbon domain-containing protein [Streptomyces lydicamycinicus]
MTHTTTCPGCGRGTAPGAAFCSTCGAALEAGEATVTLPQQPAGAPPPAATTVPLAERPADRRATVPRWGNGRDLTRYLCAAAYLDRAYAGSLIKQVAAEPHLGVAAAPACDIPVVLRHAYLANARRHSRDLVLAVLFLLAFFFSFVAAEAGITLLVLFLSWVTVFSFELSTKYGRHLQSLRPDRFDPAAAPPPLNNDIALRLRQIGDYADGNVTTYSGYSPFIGYGTELDSWSLTFDVTTSSRPEGEPEEFDVTELYAHIAERVGTLALPCLEIEERLFAEGSTLLGDTRFLPDPLGRPVSRIPFDQMDTLKRKPEEGARPYLAVHSTGWGGELVTSLFLRFVRSDSNLFVEAVPTVLFPLLDRYRIIDTLMPRPSVGELAKLVSETAVSTFFILLASPARAIAGFAPDSWMSRRLRRQHKLITRLRRFDYGARQSVRREAAATHHQRHFQKADSGMVLKTVEKRVLDALVEFAEARGIDAGELIQRQQTIINNGIIASHGSRVDSSAVASGDRSRTAMNIIHKIPLLKLD